jgi:hypothetical protein
MDCAPDGPSHEAATSSGLSDRPLRQGPVFHREPTALDLDDAGGTGSLLHPEALRSTLALVTPALERLLDSRANRRGGAVFAALRGPELICLATPMCLASRVVLDSRPFVRPLLELLDRGEPAAGGAPDLGRKELRLLEHVSGCAHRGAGDARRRISGRQARGRRERRGAAALVTGARVS